MRRFLRIFWAFLRTQTLCLMREKLPFLTILFFSLLVVLIIHFPVTDNAFLRELLAPHAIWLATFFGTTLLLARTFELEREQHVLEGLAVIPDIAGPFFSAKFLVNLVSASLLAFFNMGLVALFFNYPVGDHIASLTVPLLFSLVGICALGTTFSNMVTGHAKRDLLFPVIFYPLVVPIIIAMAQSYGEDLILTPWHIWTKLLVGIDVIFLVAAILTFEHLLRHGEA